MIQSFAPNEVTPEEAHEIGKKLATEILGGKYAFVMATHVDRGHVHNHFVWGVANIVTHKRYRSNKKSYHEIRDTSDRLCKEHSLSVIAPQNIGKCYTEYNAERQGSSWKAKLKIAIDATISEIVTSPQPTDFGNCAFDDFIKKMESQGYSVKRGAHISFKASEQTRFTRAKSLGENYSEGAIRERIAQKSILSVLHGEMPPSEPITPLIQSIQLKKLIDIESNGKIKSSPAYTQWAAIHNIKVMAEVAMFVQEHGGIDEFDRHFQDVVKDKLTLSQSLNAVDKRIEELAGQMNELTALRHNFQIFYRTKPIYQQYKSTSNFSKERFRRNNEADLDAYRAAKNALDRAKADRQGQPFPNARMLEKSINDIQREIRTLKASKPETTRRYKDKSAELRKLEVVRRNVYDMLPRTKDHTKNRDKGHDLSL